MKEYNNSVLIRGLEIAARHGVHDFEKESPQSFVFDADLFFDFSAASRSDDIKDTINYSAACEKIAEVTEKNCFNLIEKLAYECAYALMNGFSLQAVKLTVYKPQAPLKRKYSNVGACVILERERAFLSLGSSTGDRAGYLDSAIEKLRATRGIEVKKVSSFLETAPYGGVAKNAFLNCAAEIETCLSPHGLLKEINRIEEECGRVRKERWGDRTLDIDIIFFGDKILCDDDLIIPHPDYPNRDFVLKPLKEIAADFVCPLLKKRVKFM